METNNEEQFVEFDEILNFIHESTGFDKEIIEKVLDAETRFLIKAGIGNGNHHFFRSQSTLYERLQWSYKTKPTNITLQIVVIRSVTFILQYLHSGISQNKNT